MKKQLTVSVAGYNVGPYLAETLESCVVSNMDKLEVIVVNDGSTDDTLEVARGFECRYPGTFKVIDKENGGYGSTINASLEIATGKYFRYLDGDDWFDPGTLERYLESIDKIDSDAVFTPYVRVYEDGSPEEILDDLSGLAEGAYGLPSIASQQEIAACALAYKTQLLQDIHFRMDERCFYTDVEYACLPLADVETIRVLKEPLYRYRIGREGQSVSAAGIERHWPDIIRVCARLLSELGDSAFDISEYLGMSVSRECLAPYYFLTMIPASKGRKEALKAFDAQMRKSPKVYERTAQLSKSVRLLRASRFLAYTALCRRHSEAGR